MTVQSDLAKSVTRAMRPELSLAGFRKRANTFNRRATDGIIHSIRLRMCHYNARYARPTSRPGPYVLDLGVHLPGMVEFDVPDGKWIRWEDCQLRWYSFQLGEPKAPIWSLYDRLDVEDVLHFVGDTVIPHLDRFWSVQQILDIYTAEGTRGVGTREETALEVVSHLMACAPEEAEELPF